MTVMPLWYCNGRMKLAEMPQFYRGTKTLEYFNTICH